MSKKLAITIIAMVSILASAIGHFLPWDKAIELMTVAALGYVGVQGVIDNTTAKKAIPPQPDTTTIEITGGK